MKKILLIALLFLVGRESAWAGTCEEKLGLAFTPAQRIALCKSFGSDINNSLIPDLNNTYDLGTSALAWRTGYFGTSIIGTAASTLIATNTADAADSKAFAIAGGGAVGSTRGSSITVTGNEEASTGQITLEGGNIATSHINNVLRGSGAEFRVSNGGNRLWSIPSTGALTSDATNGGGIVLAKTGTTVALDSGTAATTCSGTLTANGATPVVTSTTCALTASRIFLSKQSASTAVNGSCTVTAISNGVSFTVACLATDTGTYNFWITQEG